MPEAPPKIEGGDGGQGLEFCCLALPYGVWSGAAPNPPPERNSSSSCVAHLSPSVQSMEPCPYWRQNAGNDPTFQSTAQQVQHAPYPLRVPPVAFPKRKDTRKGQAVSGHHPIFGNAYARAPSMISASSCLAYVYQR